MNKFKVIVPSTSQLYVPDPQRSRNKHVFELGSGTRCLFFYPVLFDGFPRNPEPPKRVPRPNGLFATGNWLRFIRGNALIQKMLLGDGRAFRSLSLNLSQKKRGKTAPGFIRVPVFPLVSNV